MESDSSLSVMETFATEWTEWIVHKVFFWEPDNERKGKLLRAIHHFVSNSLIVMIIVSHTVYPAFWLQTLVLAICILVWLQHVSCNGCVVSKVEQKLIGDSNSFVDPLFDLFHVTPTKELSIMVVILGSSVGVLLLSLEWIARVHHKIILMHFHYHFNCFRNT